MPSTVESDLGWALGRVVRTYQRGTADALCDVPGGARGYLVLAACVREEPSTQLALARRLGLDRTVMTHLLDDLECVGLVERRIDPTDRRVRWAVATPAAEAFLDALERRLGPAEDVVLGALDVAERHTLRALLGKAAGTEWSATDRGGTPETGRRCCPVS